MIPEIIPVNNYSGNGTTTKFDFNFYIENENQLVVYHTNKDGEQTLLELGKDYAINEIGQENGSFITFPITGSDYSILQGESSYGVGDAEKISLCLYLPISQETEYGTSDKLDQKSLEYSLDYLTRLIQILNRQMERSVKVPEGAGQTADDLIEVLQQAQIKASESASLAESSATQSAQSAEKALNHENNTQAIYNNAVELGASVQANIQALGIFMENDRLFYIGSDGVKREFRNDFGGIAPMSVKHKDIQKVDTGFALTWTDPDDSYYESNLYCKWDNTVIVRKLGSYPESPYDGDVVLVSKVRNQYANTPYIDEVDNTQDYKYRAFPCSTNRVYNLEDTNKFGQWIYSFVIIENQSIPSERIEYTGANEHYEPSYMDFTNKVHKNMDWENAPFYQAGNLDPVMLYNGNATDSDGNNLNGQIAYFLDRDNYAKKADGTASDVASTTANMNAMMRIRTLYRRIKTNSDGNTEISISNEKVNDDYKPYGGFVKPDGTIREYIYLPIYKGCLVGTTCMSISGQLPMNSKTADQERTYCQNNGEDWDMITTEDMDLIQHLFLLTHKTTDSQSALGNGYLNYSSASTSASCCKSGTLNSTGIHSYGMNNNTTQNKFLGMENVCGGNQWHRCLGEVYVNGVRKVKRCQGTSDGSTVSDFNFTGEGFITLSELPTISGTSGGYISKCQTVDDIGRYPIVMSGSSTTNDADGGWFNNSGTMVVLRGGCSNDGAICGVFTFDLNDPVSSAYWHLGSSVSYKPS